MVPSNLAARVCQPCIQVEASTTVLRKYVLPSQVIPPRSWIGTYTRTGIVRTHLGNRKADWEIWAASPQERKSVHALPSKVPLGFYGLGLRHYPSL